MFSDPSSLAEARTGTLVGAHNRLSATPSFDGHQRPDPLAPVPNDTYAADGRYTCYRNDENPKRQLIPSRTCNRPPNENGMRYGIGMQDRGHLKPNAEDQSPVGFTNPNSHRGAMSHGAARSLRGSDLHTTNHQRIERENGNAEEAANPLVSFGTNSSTSHSPAISHCIDWHNSCSTEGYLVR